ncbi:13657_t:CDS:1, partial [Rhizophagus irregularis]
RYKKPTHIQENVERVFKQTTMSRKVFDTITQEINIPVETIMLLLESSVEVAHKIYVDNMKCIGRENEKLQGRAKRMHGHVR